MLLDSRHTLHTTLALRSTRVSSLLQGNLLLNIGRETVCENHWVLGNRNFNNIYSTFDKQAKQFNTMGDISHTIHFFSFLFISFFDRGAFLFYSFILFGATSNCLCVVAVIIAIVFKMTTV